MPIDVPAPLLKAIKEQKCMLFVGSGLSSMAGYPTWSELITSLIDSAKKIPFPRTTRLEEFEQQKDYLLWRNLRAPLLALVNIQRCFARS